MRSEHGQLYRTDKSKINSQACFKGAIGHTTIDTKLPPNWCRSRLFGVGGHWLFSKMSLDACGCYSHVIRAPPCGSTRVR